MDSLITSLMAEIFMNSLTKMGFWYKYVGDVFGHDCSLVRRGIRAPLFSLVFQFIIRIYQVDARV